MQISKFKEESNLKLRHVNQLLKIELHMWTWQKKIWTRFYGQWMKSNIHPWTYAMNKTYISDRKEKNKQKGEIKDLLECTLQWKNILETKEVQPLWDLKYIHLWKRNF